MTAYNRMPTCPACGASVDAESIYCTSCGKQLSQDFEEHYVSDHATPTLCPKCGKPMREGDVFCNNCGFMLLSVPSKTNERTSSIKEQSSTPTKKTPLPTHQPSGSDSYSTTNRKNVTDSLPKTGRGSDEKEKRGASPVFLALCIAIPVFCATLVLLYVLKPNRDVPEWESQEEEAVASNADGENAVYGSTEGTVSVPSPAEGHAAGETNSESFAQEQVTSGESQASSVQETPKETQRVETPSGPPVFSEVEASSTLPPDQYTSYYGPKNAVDGNLRTAWNEGADGAGLGEWIRLWASDEQTVTGVSIVNGYTKTEEIYFRNNRPRLVSVNLSDGYSLQYELDDVFGAVQSIDFDGAHRTTYVQVTIESVYEGNTWNDSSFTEVSPY